MFCKKQLRISTSHLPALPAGRQRGGLLVPVKIVYAKIGLARYLSHLDLNRVFQRALRRSGLPIAFTKGFNPRIRISHKRALRLGKTSQHEEVTIYLTESVDSRIFKKRFQAELPAGIKLRTVKI